MLVKFGRRKDGRPYPKNTKRLTGIKLDPSSKRKRPLHIIIKNKNPRFLRVISKSINQTPVGIEDKIDSIILAKKTKRGNVGEAREKFNGRYEVEINYDGRNLPSYPLIYRHETDHILFEQIRKNYPKKMQKYIHAIARLEPFNDKLTGYYVDLMEANRSGDKKRIKEAVEIYVDEFHSETKEATDRLKLGLDKTKIDLKMKRNLAQALKAYNDLHKNIKIIN
jgi:hypothetical protein